MMKIVIEENDDLVAYRLCFICGEQYETALVMAVAYTNQGVRKARICNECIKAGLVGMRKRAHDYAQNLARAAERTQRIAEALDGEDVQVPDYEELELRLKSLNKRY